VGHPYIFFHLTDEQNNELLTLEKPPFINNKVRLRASIVRLSNSGFNIEQLSQHFQRSTQAIRDDVAGFEQHGIAGLVDAPKIRKPSQFTTEITTFLKTKLELDCVWNSSLLSEAVKQEFKVTISAEGIRVKLLELGCSWKRSRYSPGKTPDENLVAEFKAALDTLKKGQWIKS
jgi:transposase